MNPVHPGNISLDKLPPAGAANNLIQFYILRLDKIHSEISGNKWFKLRYYIEDAIQQQKQTIATFGGAWSNHLLATAAFCKSKGLNSIGIVRGERPENFSFTLTTAASLGMKLIFTSREHYQQKIMPAAINELSEEVYLIDEGGYGMQGADGAATIADYYKHAEFSHVCCAVGTGTMMAGLIKAALPGQKIIGFSILKNNLEIDKLINALLPKHHLGRDHSIIHDHHFGGYAKKDFTLIRFMNQFYKDTQIPTDFVYTGKMIYGAYDLAAKNFFLPGSRVLLIHSGGLQGNNSLPPGTLIF